MKLSMKNGVITVTGEGKTIEVETVDGELVVYGDSDVIIEELEDEDGEEVIEFEDEPDKPTNAFAHLEDRVKPYDIIDNLVVGDKVRLKKDLTWEIDNVIDIGLADLLIKELEPLDSFKVEHIMCSYDEHSEKEEPEVYAKGWHISTRWVEKVEG